MSICENFILEQDMFTEPRSYYTAPMFMDLPYCIIKLLRGSILLFENLDYHQILLGTSNRVLFRIRDNAQKRLEERLRNCSEMNWTSMDGTCNIYGRTRLYV